MSGFAGRTAVVTGGGSGIGRALGEELARRGAAVVLADRDGEAAERVAAAIARDGGEALAERVDVRDADAVRALVGRAARLHGRLDLVFNNAGVSMVGEARHVDLEGWRRLIDVNLWGVIHGVHAAYPLMIEQGSGQIVNTASIAGLVPFPLGVPYNASKFAIVGLSTSLRAEAAGYGVRVNVVCPGFIDTPLKDSLEYVGIDKSAAMRELPFALKPVDACARAILRGVARDRPIILIGTEAKVLWRLERFAPGLVRLVGRIAAQRARTRIRAGSSRGAADEETAA